jgi:bile acid-coenzyme A ligase
MDLIAQFRPEFVLLVPTMMHRIWGLPADERAVVMSSIRTVFHVASPCPVWLKQAWIDWLGAHRIFELYGASDSPANTVISGAEWLEHRGSGRARVARRDPGNRRGRCGSAGGRDR